jgi:hypothetical protein
MKPKEDLRVIYLIIGLLVLIDISFVVLYGIYTFAITRPMELGMSGECNSGNIGLDYQSSYNDTLITTTIGSGEYSFNMTSAQGFVPRVLNIKGIDNLNCKFQMNAKGTIFDLMKLMGAK